MFGLLSLKGNLSLFTVVIEPDIQVAGPSVHPDEMTSRVVDSFSRFDYGKCSTVRIEYLPTGAAVSVIRITNVS